MNPVEIDTNHLSIILVIMHACHHDNSQIASQDITFGHMVCLNRPDQLVRDALLPEIPPGDSGNRCPGAVDQTETHWNIVKPSSQDLPVISGGSFLLLSSHRSPGSIDITETFCSR